MTRDLCISKGGRFFSKICSKKFDDRTNRQRLFIDKLELLEGKAPSGAHARGGENSPGTPVNDYPCCNAGR